MGFRIIVLGAGGLIGHKLFEQLSRRFGGDVFGTLHGDRSRFGQTPLFQTPRVIDNVDVLGFDRLTQVIQATGAGLVLNCVGITKRRAQIHQMHKAIAVNAWFPHRLSRLGRANGSARDPL